MGIHIASIVRGVQAKLRDSFWRNNVVFFVGSIGVGVLNYLYYPLIGHLLPPYQFGEVQVLFAILLDIVVLFTALSMMVVNITANAKGEHVRDAVLGIERIVVSLFYVLFAVWLAVVPLFAGFLRIDSSIPLIVLYLVIFVSLIISIRQAFIQGMQDFMGVTTGSLLAALGKLVFSAALVMLGFGVTGAIFGLAIGQLAGVVYVSLRGRRHGVRFDIPRPRLVKSLGELAHLRYIVPTLIVSLTVTALFSFDTIAAKHFFAPDLAGLYAGAATIGRIILFATAPIATVMFSSLKLDQSRRENAIILRRSLLLTLAGGGVCALLFVALPGVTIALLFGHQYDAAARFLPPLAGSLFLASFVNLILYYDLALRYKRAIWIGGAGLVAFIVMIVLHHGSPLAIITDIFATCILVLGMRLITYGVTKH